MARIQAYRGRNTLKRSEQAKTRRLAKMKKLIARMMRVKAREMTKETSLRRY
jgi:hypothetical protein